MLFSAVPNIWIGLSGSRSTGWTWSDDSTLGNWATDNTYPWHSNDPNGRDTLNCVRLIIENGDYVWADQSCPQDFTYLCSRPFEAGLISLDFVTLLYDNNEWEFLMNRDTAECKTVNAEEDNFPIQTVFINQLPLSNYTKLQVILYFESKTSCQEMYQLAVLTPDCSGQNVHYKCTTPDSSSFVEKTCSYYCPIIITENKVSVSIITNPIFGQVNAKLCEMEFIYI